MNRIREKENPYKKNKGHDKNCDCRNCLKWENKNYADNYIPKSEVRAMIEEEIEEYQHKGVMGTLSLDKCFIAEEALSDLSNKLEEFYENN